MSNDTNLGYNEDFPSLVTDGSRELTAQEWIIVHKPESYATIAQLVDYAMEHQSAPCRGGECDDCGSCERHERTTRVADRLARMRNKRWYRLKVIAAAYMRAESLSVAEYRLRLELDRFPEWLVEHALDRACSEVFRVNWKRAFPTEDS